MYRILSAIDKRHINSYCVIIFVFYISLLHFAFSLFLRFAGWKAFSCSFSSASPDFYCNKFRNWPENEDVSIIFFCKIAMRTNVFRQKIILYGKFTCSLSGKWSSNNMSFPAIVDVKAGSFLCVCVCVYGKSTPGK